MDEISKALASPAWWVLTVLVGLGLNLVSSYFKEPLDRFISSISNSRRAKLARETEEFQKKALALSRSPDEMTALFQNEIRIRLMQVKGLLFAMLFFGFCGFLMDLGPRFSASYWVAQGSAAMAIVLLFVTVYANNVVGETGELLKAARKLQREEASRTPVDGGVNEH
jgi:uncharacterized membrane protein